jgi:hypothetical protein
MLSEFQGTLTDLDLGPSTGWDEGHGNFRRDFLRTTKSMTANLGSDSSQNLHVNSQDIVIDSHLNGSIHGRVQILFLRPFEIPHLTFRFIHRSSAQSWPS